jgi:hypothetical protein
MISVRAEGAYYVKTHLMTFADAGVVLWLACIARLAKTADARRYHISALIREGVIMLVTFSCPAYANITMFGDVAVHLLELMGHSGKGRMQRNVGQQQLTRQPRVTVMPIPGRRTIEGQSYE